MDNAKPPVLAILEESVTGAQTMSPSQLVARIRASGLETAAESTSLC
jgi:hypothetical protein